MPPKQCTDTLLMVRPAAFGFNPYTAASNSFQKDAHDATEIITQKAKEEFDACTAILKQHDVHVIVIEDSEIPAKTDAVFPNNWFSTHADGTLCLYPMMAPNRRLERREDIIQQLLGLHPNSKLIDWSVEHESEDQFLESTGSMILDRVNRVVYACLSSRTDQKLLEKWGEKMEYDVVAFHSTNPVGLDVYHTNVMMALGEKFAIVCMESIPLLTDKLDIQSHLEASGHELIDITWDQVEAFAGNMLEIRNTHGKSLLALSQQALDSLTEDQKNRLSAYAELLPFPLNAIEVYGGGGIRCMMAEIFF